MRGIAIERWWFQKRKKVVDWLTEISGPPSPTTWDIDYDHDLETLRLSDELYILYSLRWL